MLQLKKDLLTGIFGQERATALLDQVASSVRDRDLLHNSLLQRKSKLQVSPTGCLPGTGAQQRRGPPLGVGGRRRVQAALHSDLSSATCHSVALSTSVCPHNLWLFVCILLTGLLTTCLPPESTPSPLSTL